MPMMKKLALLAVAFGLSLAVHATSAFAITDKEAESFVEDLIDQAIHALKIDPANEAERRQAFQSLLTDKFDIDGIRQRVLGRAWRDATDAQKAAFADVFDDYILNIYVGQLGPYNDEVVRLKRTEQMSDDEMIVFSEVVNDNGPALRLDWRVHRINGDGLGVLDVAADGASLLRAKRDEFKEVIQRSGIDGLIERLKELNTKYAES
ncbi:MAG: hypothetical protein CMM50_01905 [Rhodospirillaceae bacterium]|nr:hypothetical protein [Rhodospirillaceae bacterium]